MLVQRFIALFIMVASGIAAMIGWNLMKNSYISMLASESFLWGSFLGGLVLFILGLGFIAGFVFHRDRKRRLVQPRFMKKKKSN